ncbi:MAG: hypothetical protein IIZ41_06055 [Lachnospiraceae bacterium]|nr:hypothetical protein [Lachnospiraceae bacterium]
MNNTFDFNTHPLTSKLKHVESAGTDKWRASCPCGRNHKNDDRNQSLSVEYDRDKQTLLVYCFTGCSVAEICKETGCSVSDLFFRKDPSSFISWYANKNGFTFIESYSYCYGSYNDGLCKVRFRLPDGTKDFRWIHEDDSQKSGYRMKHSGLHRLYAAGSMNNNTVIIVEGEKDANTVHNLINVTAVSAENGASRKTGGKWLPEYNKQLSGKTVYILWDNDEIGKQFAQIEAQNVAKTASAVYMLDLPQAWPECPEKADISDYVKEVGPEEAAQTLTQLIATAEEYIVPEEPETGKEPPEGTAIIDQKTSKIIHTAPVQAELPEWIFTVPTKNGDVKKINEPVFCECFKKAHHVARINGVFYFDGEAVSDDFILNEIQKMIQVHFVERVGILTNNICKTLANACYTTQPEPDERKVYCADYITLTIQDNGDITYQEEDIFTLTRIPVKYDPAARCPTFEKYLHDIFYEEDIPALQEFVGYCLVATTRAQAGLFIHGKGGEGKSVFRDVLMKLFGHTAKQESISNLDKQFVFANLENILVCIDDDMEVSLMGETSMIKKIITSKGKQQVERKHMQKHDALIFARLIGIGNSFIGSKFDQSDGFYRRQLLIDVKPKTREQDDRFMPDKCTAEIQGVLNWALEGLSRLIKNGFCFSISDRMKSTLYSIRRENDNVLDFLENNVDDTGEQADFISSADLFAAYALDCKDNGDMPVKKKTFQSRISEKYRNRKERRIQHIPGNYERNRCSVDRKIMGYVGLRFIDPVDGYKWMGRLHNILDYNDESYIERLT